MRVQYTEFMHKTERQNKDYLIMLNFHENMSHILVQNEAGGGFHFTYTFTSLRNKVVSELRKTKINFFLTLTQEANGSSSTLWQ